MTVRDKFDAEMKLVWGNSQKMINHCTKKAFDVVGLESGHVFVIDKPSIETRFCFGCGQFGSATDEEMNNASERQRAIHKFENFKNENIKGAFGRVLKEIENGYGYYIEYQGGKQLVGIVCKNERCLDWMIENNRIVALMTDNDRIAIKSAVDKAIKRFEKRLETYWKKYKDTKLNTWTYIVD